MGVPVHTSFGQAARLDEWVRWREAGEMESSTLNAMIWCWSERSCFLSGKWHCVWSIGERDRLGHWQTKETKN